MTSHWYPLPLQDHILVVGWKWMMVVSGEDGMVAAATMLPCQAISPPVITDFTNDGSNDVIITCAEA